MNKLDLFLEKAKKIHSKKYDYSGVIYINNKTKVKIKCEKHGYFEQTPSNHTRGTGCPKCVGKKQTINEIIKELKVIHSNKYNYLINDETINKSSKIDIICSFHGIFSQRISHHLSGSGCPKCVGKYKTNEEFIEQARKVHGDRYDYSKVLYKNDISNVIILCTKHGEFKQRAGKHLQSQGCPLCKESKGERDVRNLLIENKINFIRQKRFKDCRDKKPLPFDFYLPKYNMCIEYHGRQHYEPVSIFGGNKEFELIKRRDKIKMEYCNKNSIPLIIIKFDESRIFTVLTNSFKHFF